MQGKEARKDSDEHDDDIFGSGGVSYTSPSLDLMNNLKKKIG